MSELLSIVVPVFNEEATVGAVIARLLAIDLPVPREILVVNDGSTDGTRGVLDGLPLAGDTLRIVHAAVNGGKGRAIRTGFEQARGTIIAIQDADLELDPAELAGLVAPILARESQAVYGSRFLNGTQGAPLKTVLANRFLTGLTNVLYGSRLTDMETCYKIMRADVARALQLECNRFDIEPEITAKLLRAGHRIVERPVRFEPRSRAQGKKIGWRDGVQAIAVLLVPPFVIAVRLLVLGAAVAVGAVGLWWGTWAVGGSDSSCYALMAAAFAEGSLQPTTALTEAPWPDAARTFAPGGFVPSPSRRDAASPICTPGFSLLLAPLLAVGGRDALFLLTPVAGALLVWLTFLFGRHLAGPSAGAAAALVVAAMPVFVFQLVQPMNDVVVATLWMAIMVLAARPKDYSGWIGALTGLAILVRPNLAPAVIVVAAWLLMGGVARLLRFGAAAAPFVLLVGFFNAVLYGHPLQSGYGSAADLFAARYVTVNSQNYGNALLETQLGFPLIGLLMIVVAPAQLRRLVWFTLSIAASITLVYLFYKPFPEWWYLRFLLPVLPMMIALAMAALVFATRRTLVVWPVTAIVVAFAMTTDAMGEALDLQQLEGRFRTVGAIARERLPANAVFITVWNSGSVRYHADREAILWDSLDPGALDDAVAWLATRGLEPYLVLEEWEEPAFRARFGGRSALADLDWPPRYRILPSVRIFRISDRARYTAGETIPTELVWDGRQASVNPSQR